MKINPKYTNQAAFTLLELLVSMAILAVMVIFLGIAFSRTVESWTFGEKQVSVHDAGRAVAEAISSDVLMSIADEILPFAVNNGFHVDGSIKSSATGPSGGRCDSIYLVAASEQRRNSNVYSDNAEIAYFLTFSSNGVGRLSRRSARLSQFNIAPRYVSGDRDAYGKLFNKPFYLDLGSNTLSIARGGVDLIADNIFSFEVAAKIDGVTIQDFYSKTYASKGFIPDELHVKFSILSNDDWKRYEDLQSQAWIDYVNRNKVDFELRLKPMVRRL